MACKNICRVCKRLIVSQGVTFASGVLTIDIPAGTYNSGEKYCIVIAQPIPDAATINSPVVISIDGEGGYPLYTTRCVPAVSSQLHTRTRYSTRVVTSASTAHFQLLGDLPYDTYTDIQSIP